MFRRSSWNLTAGQDNYKGKLFYPVCGSLVWPPYKDGKYLSWIAVKVTIVDQMHVFLWCYLSKQFRTRLVINCSTNLKYLWNTSIRCHFLWQYELHCCWALIIQQPNTCNTSIVTNNIHVFKCQNILETLFPLFITNVKVVLQPYSQWRRII